IQLIRSHRLSRYDDERHDFGTPWRGDENRGEKLVTSLRAWLLGLPVVAVPEAAGLSVDEEKPDTATVVHREEGAVQRSDSCQEEDAPPGFVSVDELLQRVTAEIAQWVTI
ncbi:hypothetical protein HKX48_001925, partial [Thoreauomyces humboldtii]